MLLTVVVVDDADAFNIIGRHNQRRPSTANHYIRYQHHHTSSVSSSSGPALSAVSVSVDEEDVLLESSSSLYGFEKSKLLSIRYTVIALTVFSSSSSSSLLSLFINKKDICNRLQHLQFHSDSL